MQESSKNISCIWGLINGYSYLILIEIAVGCRKLKSFQETQVNLNGLLDKPGIRYPARNS